MADNTGIQWTDATWNPVRGCSRVSPGCVNCYAERTAARFSGPGKPYDGLVRLGDHGPRWTGKVQLVPHVLDQPRRWRKPRRIFVNSMSDLFHEKLSDWEISEVFHAMDLAPQHTFQVLTKRAERMRAWFGTEHGKAYADALPNVWLGVSVEDQQRADERIPHLLATPAAVRFLSCEPLLGPVDLRVWMHECTTTGCGDKIHWVIVGGESGPGARDCNESWVRGLVNQCRAYGVACFVKQLGANFYDDVSWSGSEPRYDLRDKKGGDMSEWPEGLAVRQFPEDTGCEP